MMLRIIDFEAFDMQKMFMKPLNLATIDIQCSFKNITFGLSELLTMGSFLGIMQCILTSLLANRNICSVDSNLLM